MLQNRTFGPLTIGLSYMIHVKNIIQQMKEEDYHLLLARLKETNAEKFSFLLTSLKEDRHTEKEIMEKLGASASAYYTLKSRLHSRIQEFLSTRMGGSKTDMLRRVSTIPDLLFNSPRNTAIAVLTKLEKELLGYDMPYELTNVYNALKKLHVSSPKYYQYEQLYNRHVAYTIALDKAQDTLSAFNKMLGSYYLSRDKSLPEVLWVMKKEMTHLCKLYESHHLSVYKNILDVSFALFVPLPQAVEQDEPVEDILSATEKILVSYPHDAVYGYLRRVINFLWFEYYHQAKLYKKEAQYFDLVNENAVLLMNYNFCCFSSRFLLSKVERYILLGNTQALHAENQEMFKGFATEPDAQADHLNFSKYTAAGAFYSGNYGEAASLMNDVLNTMVFKNIAHSEVEVKLFLSLCFSMQDKYENAYNVLKSVSRKIREMENRDQYEHALVFVKMLSLQMDSESKGREEKLLSLRDKFQLLNQGATRMLEFLDLSDDFIKKLSKSVKN